MTNNTRLANPPDSSRRLPQKRQGLSKPCPKAYVSGAYLGVHNSFGALSGKGLKVLDCRLQRLGNMNNTHIINIFN